MPSFLPSRRSAGGLTLQVRSADDLTEDDGSQQPEHPQLAWYWTALLAGAAAAVAGWVLVVALVVLMWLPARAGAVLDAVMMGTQVWILGNGGGLVADGQRWTLVPLTLSLLMAIPVWIGAHQAARSGLQRDVADGVEHNDADRFRIVLNVTLVTALAYAVPVTVTTSLVATTEQGVRVLVGAALLSVLAAHAGAARAVRHRLADVLPPWAAGLPGAVRAGLATALVGGAAAVVAALCRHFGQVTALTREMGDDPLTSAMVTLTQVAYLPNAVLWATSWVLGAGFRLGDGSLVALRDTDLGLLPPVPMLGALPPEGAGSPWALLWMLVGVAAGVVAAVTMLLRRPHARFDETSLSSGAAGVLAGLALTAVAAISGGDIGTQRLVGLGPRLGELALLSCALMGVSALAVGLVGGLLRRPLTSQADDPDLVAAYEDDELEDDGYADHELVEDDEDDEDEPTTDLGAPEPDEPEPEPDESEPDEPEPEAVEGDEPTEVVEQLRRRWNPFARRNR